MQQQGAYVSVDQICREWLAKREKSIHTYWKALLYAGEAVQELTLSTLPLLQHTVISRKPNQNWFDLPKAMTAVVSVGIPYRGTWRPIGTNNTIISFPRYNGNSDLGSGFGDGFNQGVQLNPGDNGVSLASFAGDDFSAEDFATASVPEGVDNQDWFGPDAAMFNRFDTVSINLSSNQIFTGPHFPVDKIYLVYVSVGAVDTMTRIPIIAKKAIETYISWQYEATKRDGVRNGLAAEGQWIRQHKILRARLNQLTITKIKQINTGQWARNFDPTEWQGTKTNDNGGSITPTPPATGMYYVWSDPAYAIPANAAAIKMHPSFNIPVDLSKVITFPSTGSEYLYFAFPKDDPDPTDYFINQFDFGTLGTGGTFGQSIIIDGMRLIISNFPTQIIDPVTFS